MINSEEWINLCGLFEILDNALKEIDEIAKNDELIQSEVVKYLERLLNERSRKNN